MIEQFYDTVELAENQKNRIIELEKDLNNIKNNMHCFFDSFDYLKNTISKK